MAISNELSSEIASALLVNKSPQELKKLKEIILKVHSALQEMADVERADRMSDEILLQEHRPKIGDH